MPATNLELWNKLRAMSPTFASHTSEGTKDLFTEKGFDSIQRQNATALNEFFELSIKTVLNKITVSRAKNPLEGSGLIERYANPYGGYLQRISINSIKPVTPAFKGLQDGDSVDMQIVRKPNASERFYEHNFDYQSFITIQDWQARQIFVAETGMSAFLAGIMEALANGYTIQEYVNVMAAMNEMINNLGIKPTQIVELSSWTTESPTVSEMKDFIFKVRQIVGSMRVLPQTGAFNINGFESTVNDDDLVLLVRQGVKDHIAIDLLSDAYNRDELAIPVEVYEVADFGGLLPYATVDVEGVSTNIDLLANYDESTGEQIGWVDADGTERTLSGYTDTNENVLAVLVQRGAIFTADQVPIRTEPAPRNVRGLYQNYFASAANNMIRFDKNYNFVLFKKPQATEGGAEGNNEVTH